MSLKRIKTIIWDFDGVWYDYNTLPNRKFYDIWNTAAAKAVCDIFPELDFAEAKRLAKHSYELHHNFTSTFAFLAARHGIDEAALKIAIHDPVHGEALKIVMKDHPELFNLPKGTSEAMYRLIFKKIRHGILTHSCVDRWASPILHHMDLRHHFQDHHMMGHADFDFINKGESAEPLTRLMDRMECRPSETAFVEDNLKALEVAKEEYPEITSVYRPEDYRKVTVIPPYIDMVIRTPLDFLSQIEQSYRPVFTGKPFMS